MALKEHRKASRSTIATIFVGGLVVMFALWGVGDIFKVGLGRGVARIGGDWISAADYQERLRQVADIAGRRQGKPISLEEAKALGLPAQVLDQMVTERTLAYAAQQMGLAVHDDTLTRIIQSNSSFQGPDGKFDANTYKFLLQQNHMTPAFYEGQLRGDIARIQLEDAILSGASVPSGLLQALIAYRGEQREASYLLLDPSLAGEIPPADKATLEKIINADKPAFSTPELRSFVALLFRPSDFAARVNVADKEIEESYKFHLEQYKVPEKRTARVVAFQSEAEARAAMQQLQSHAKSFEDVARAHGVAANALTAKPMALKDFDDSEVGGAVFKAEKPGLVGPINGALAWAIADYQSDTPESTKPLDQVREEIRQSLAKTHAEELIDDTMKKFEDLHAGGSTLEEIATKLGAAVVKYGAVDAQGKDRNGKQTVSGPETEDLMKMAFQAEQGTDTDAQNLKAGGQAVVRVDTIAPPALRPFTENEPQARKIYEDRERAARLMAKAQAVAAKHAKDGLGAAGTELGLTPITLPEPMRRGVPNAVFSADLVEKLYQSPPQTLVVGDAASPGKLVIAVVLKTNRPGPAEVAAVSQKLAPQVGKALGEDLAVAYLEAAKKRAGVRTNKSLFDQATSGARF